MPLQELFPGLEFEQISFIWDILKDWIWFPLVIFLFPVAKNLYLYFIRDRWKARIQWVTLEIKIPREVLKPVKAMENVFSTMWAVYDPPNPREKWLEGKILLPFSLEMVSIEGEPHFFIFVPKRSQNLVESAIYSQYSDVQISVVADYTKYVPTDIPNKDWDLWGTDYILAKDSPYPIRTHTFFEEVTEAKEEKRIDPLSALLEGMAKLGKGEQLWVQITATPVTPMENPWVKQGEMIRDKLAKRPLRPAPKPLIQEAAEVLIAGPPTAAPAQERELFPPEMRLTPGERDIIMGVENKIAKYGFDTNIRFIYLAKRDAFFSPNVRLAMGFFNAYSTQNLNSLRPWFRTITKVRTIFLWFLDARRLFIRKRRLFRNYMRRFPPFYPRKGGTFVLNTEELASLFHFPGKIVAPAPTLPRIEAKRREAPPSLPVE